MLESLSIVWAILIVVFVVVEGQTLGLTSIWFAVGSLGGLIAALIGVPVMAQVIVFTVITAIMLIYTRPIARKHLKIGSKKTNINALIGEIGVVTKEISVHQYGQVKLKGQIWTAKSIDEATIAVEQEVEILAIEGVKLIVRTKSDN